MDKIKFAPAIVVLYNANVFEGYRVMIIDKFFLDKGDVKSWIDRDLIPKMVRYTMVQEIIFPAKFDKGYYYADFDDDMYPDRDKEGNWKCGKCKKKKNWSDVKCC